MQDNERITRDEMLVRMAVIASERGTCLRARVGAVVSRNGRVISTGYVGAPAGLPHCLEVGCDISEHSGCIRTVHAEANAIAWAARYGISTERAEIHCTYSPCASCAKLLINAGIVRVVYVNQYRDLKPLAMLGFVGVEVEQHA